MQYLSCSFTGHRPSRFAFGFDEESAGCLSLKSALLSQIQGMCDRGVTTFLSGMALGTDLWAAEAVLALKKRGRPLRLVCVLPCETQADRWAECHRERYFSILEGADEVLYISCRYTPDCMARRNRYLIDHSDFLIAVYDGGDRGGTAYTVDYARHRGRSIVVIDPATAAAAPDLPHLTPGGKLPAGHLVLLS